MYMAVDRQQPGMNWGAFGEWITRKQETLRISDRELSRRTGISPTHIGDLKKGLSGTKQNKVVSIAQALHAQESEAFQVLGVEKPELTPEEVEILNTMRNVPHERKWEFVQIVKATGSALSCQ